MNNVKANYSDKNYINLSLDKESILSSSAILNYYHKHLVLSIDWLLRSIKESGGSSAYFSILGWSNPYPETTGYIIPTLLNYSRKLNDPSDLISKAESLGKWLLSIQNSHGFWNGGKYGTSNKQNPSVFNTAQILKGMAALYLETGDSKWIDAGYRGAKWLSDNLNSKGLWEIGNYKPGFNPSYYTQVAWPMLEIWNLTNDDKLKTSATKVLDRIILLRQNNGVIKGWGFDDDKPAFTHTIAYTIRSFQESARILNQYEKYEKPTRKALDHFIKSSELNNGRIPGAYYTDLKPVKNYSCLTGNVQLAICFLNYYLQTSDLRIVNAAAKAIDYVCSKQCDEHFIKGLKGAVAGSSPIYGKYMILRYPNWAVKYLADALMKIISILKKEGL